MGEAVCKSRTLALFCLGVIFEIILSASWSSNAQSEAAVSELSFTAQQIASGKTEYQTNCTDCHGTNLNDGEFGGPPLKGSIFAVKWFKLPVSALVGYVQTAMPPDNAGRMPLGTYVEIVAYLLNQNGIAPGPKELPANMSALASLRYPLQRAP
jgi:Cytochrome C oxidase, cbb3-type, subunit III